MGETPKAKSVDEQIGERLRIARRRLALTQTDFALRAGIGRERLASYEVGRVPIPWEIAKRMCSLYDINPAWLVEGSEPADVFIDFTGGIAPENLPPRATLREIYALHGPAFYKRLPGAEAGGLANEELLELRKQVGPRRQHVQALVDQIIPLFEKTESREDRWRFYSALVTAIGQATMRAMRKSADKR